LTKFNAEMNSNKIAATRQILEPRCTSLSLPQEDFYARLSFLVPKRVPCARVANELNDSFPQAPLCGGPGA
jgi:hypothetical protein